jgi:hypothetical protein
VVLLVRHGRRIRVCLLRGPRGLTGPVGPRGVTGPRGPQGLKGTNGTKGTTGLTGPPGTARAYAVVAPTSTSPAAAARFISGQSANITAVNEVKPGVYCLTTAAGINPEADTAAVSPEVSYSAPGKAPGVIALNAQHSDCPAGNFEVETYPQASEKPESGFAFTIVIP